MGDKKGETSGKATDIKAKARVRTLAYFTLGIAGLIAVPFGATFVAVDLAKVPMPARLASAGLLMLGVVAAAVDSLLGSHPKNVLVFWRIKNPLPGCRAFTNANLYSDHRINRERLRDAVGGKFPRSARDQNSLWYDLHRKGDGDNITLGLGYQFILNRDLAWFSIVLALLSLAEAVLLRSGSSTLLVILFVLLYGLFARAAVVSGHKLVNQVLASASTTHK